MKEEPILFLARDHDHVSQAICEASEAAGIALQKYRGVDADSMQRQSTRSHSLKDELQSLFLKAKLPTNPAIAAQIISLVEDPNSSAEQFARVIENDPALAASLIKVGNSSFFSQRHPVTSIQRAVTVLGLRRIRMAAVSFQLVSHLDRLGNVSFDLPSFWQHSVLRACMARELAAKIVPEHAEEAFLVGLLQDCGILLMVQLLGEEYGELYGNGGLSPTAFYAAERDQYPYNHVDVITIMGEEWHFSEILAHPLSQHHERVQLEENSSPHERLCAVSYFVGALRWTDGQHTDKTEPHLLNYATNELGLDEESLQACFVATGDAYQSVKELFGDVLPGDIDVAELLDQANRQLSLAVQEGEVETEQVRIQRDQYLQERTTLRSAVAQYRERASRDPLTGLLNRGALLEAAVQCQREIAENNCAITVLFLDIDNFKKVNDECGHSFGDEVLKMIASIIMDSVSDNGSAGRFGGEEFVIMLPGLGEEEARRLASQLVMDIRGMDYARLGLNKPVTCSIGALWGRIDLPPERLIALADQLMYEAKRAGKDQCIFKSVENRSSGQSAMNRKGSSDSCSDETASRNGEKETNLEILRKVAEALQFKESSTFVNSRKQPRRELLVPARLAYLKDASLTVGIKDVFVRNISAGGLALLSDGRMIRGDLIEVSMTRGKDECFYAGLVSFCRQISNGVHEIGVQIVDQGDQPIFSHNPAQAIKDLNWINEVIQDRHEDTQAPRRSA